MLMKFFIFSPSKTSEWKLFTAKKVENKFINHAKMNVTVDESFYHLIMSFGNRHKEIFEQKS